MKATHQLSVADAWIGAAAFKAGAVLVHKDPELAVLNSPQMEPPP